MENATMEEMKREALARMTQLKLMGKVIHEFRDEGKLNYSEGGFLYWVEGDMLKLVQDFEKEHGCLVYHVVKSDIRFGTLLSFLYVPKEKEEWAMERQDIKEGYIFSYVANLDCEEFSEFGSIVVKNRFGGLVRVG